jgi:hypothetical protein
MNLLKVKESDYKHKLFPEQTDAVLKNWWRLLNIKEVVCIFNGKPNFSDYNINKFRIPRYTRFATRYTVFHCKGNDYGDLFFIVIDTNHFDKIEISICSWFDHMFEPYIVPGNYTRPQIFICTLSELTTNNYEKIPDYLFIGPYRIVSLWDMYSVIGSMTGRTGYTYGYKLFTDLPLEYNGRDYAGITNYDPMCKILNAIPSDVIEYKRIINECSPYVETMRRRVLNVSASNSGCFTGGADRTFYRDYEVDHLNRLINRPAYLGPKDVKNMSEWPKLEPILTKKEYYDTIKRTDPNQYAVVLEEDQHMAENYESFKKGKKSMRHRINVVTVEDDDDVDDETPEKKEDDDEPSSSTDDELDENEDDEDFLAVNEDIEE